MSDSSAINDPDDQGQYVTGECTFSPAWGGVRLVISDDGMEVVINAISGDETLCKTLTPEKVSAFLHDNKITHGVDHAALAELVGDLILEPNWTGDLVVAEGKPPTVPGGAEFSMFKGAKVERGGSDVLVVDGETLSFSTVKNYLDQKTKPVDIPDVVAKMVSGGEILVSKTQPYNGRPGRDVFGRAIAPPAFGEVVDGENVQLLDGGLKFSASLLGYLLLFDRQLSVVSPIVVSDDQMTAWFVQFPQIQPAKKPFIMDITVLLAKAGVVRGTEGAQVEALCLELSRTKESGWYVAARGKEPIPGEDGKLLFEGTDPPSALRDDGSIDFKVLNLVKTVEAGSHFATLCPPTKGTSGYTLMDEALPAEPGKPLKVDAKNNVRVEEEGERVFYYAESDGVIQYQNGRLEIDPLYQVKGNVDFSTGNIDVDCCLAVAGNVCSDFTVKSAKDIVVSGTLEPGAKVIVSGDLQVKGGIIGENTEVMVLGNLQAEYVQDAKIVVKGQILINQYAFSAIIRSVGSIQVGPGTGERGGSVVGGTICSSARIEAKTMGSPSNILTTVVVEPAPHKLAKLKQLKGRIAKYEANITKIMRTLNLEAIEPVQVKELLEQANPKQRRLYIEILNQLNLLVKEQQLLLHDKNKMSDALWRDVDKMSVQVNKACYTNTKVRIARKEFLNRRDRGRTSVIHDRSKLKVDSSKGEDDILPE